VKISDIDFERRTIHIRQSKYEKDRIVPLADCMAVGLKKYLKAENPHIWLFNGKEPDGRYSVRGLSRVMRENLKAGKRQARGQVPGAIHPPGSHYQPAHPEYYRWQGNLPGKGLSGQGCQKACHTSVTTF